ncbi:rhomboid family intramembrane serine protease [Seonamhaeicola marinus]|uniref:Rhomboid family intramembrane serine protease n=1 Tax=Seonamhaeicola marinus TaxID=1912246 RepID=A0A5D0IMW3_9FLAO|nr:rhomboid family intramembrane serine protease [Seonamhaeicola marinus]TYA84369.1 rhomboid family intramembrane serine protease [Seonamhaeicola marinus]
MWKELKIKYNLAAIHEKLMILNIGVFAIVSLITTLVFLFTDSKTSFFTNYFAVPANIGELIFKPWTLVSYFFLHTEFWHLLGNMVALYFFGRIFLSFFSSKLLLKYYILGGLVAGIAYILSYNIFPALTKTNGSILLGASGAVFAVLFGVTAKAPNYIFNFFNILRIPLWVLSALYTILFISSIPIANAGGELAHLGGAFLGYFYTKRLEAGKDIGSWIEKLMNSLSNMFKASKKSKLKTVHKNKSKVGGYTKADFNEFNNQKKIDVILDKISKSGYDSLTAEEKDLLFRAGK